MTTSHDLLNRIVQDQIPGWGPTAYTCDPNSNLTAITPSGGVDATSYTYAPADRLDT